LDCLELKNNFEMAFQVEEHAQQRGVDLSEGKSREIPHGA